MSSIFLLLIVLVAAAFIIWLIFYALGRAPLQEPMRTPVTLLIVAVVVIFLLFVLYSLLLRTGLLASL